MANRKSIKRVIGSQVSSVKGRSAPSRSLASKSVAGRAGRKVSASAKLSSAGHKLSAAGSKISSKLGMSSRLGSKSGSKLTGRSTTVLGKRSSSSPVRSARSFAGVAKQRLKSLSSRVSARKSA